ncbi:MAG: hypothetical protein HOK55_03425 [Gammaproteobacteria bacterium]|jgi:hypothetical protein|nr:hypothetical protein [Gammaproteobacteria bacterium]
MHKLKKIFLLSMLISVSPSIWAQATCDPAGDVEFICGLMNAEDLVQVPESDWIISSAMIPNTGFYLIDANTGASQTPDIRTNHDQERYPLCASSPDMNRLETHGLNIRATGRNHATLYAVAHGARESIEIYDVDTSDGVPQLTWRGCVAMPEGLAANSVASFADGSIVTTVLLMPGKSFGDSVAMRPTGAVFKWIPGEREFIHIENSELPGNNGIEVSADGSEIYVVSSGFQTIVAFSNTNPARQLRTTQQLPITPDNVHMDSNGMLLTGGMKNEVPECGGPPGPQHDLAALGTCPRGSIAIEINPGTMAVKVLVETPALSEFSNATMVLNTGNRLWFGTFSGDRIAYLNQAE